MDGNRKQQAWQMQGVELEKPFLKEASRGIRPIGDLSAMRVGEDKTTEHEEESYSAVAAIIKRRRVQCEMRHEHHGDKNNPE